MERRSKSSAPIALSLICFCFGAGLVNAQPADELDTVATRERSSLDPLGLRTGSFRIFPELGLGHFRNDNIFATPDNVIADSVVVLSPALTIRSDWTRNVLDFGFNAAINDYSEFDTEDHEDRQAFVRGRWDTANEGYFYGSIDSSVEHEGRESVNDRGGLERTRVDRDEARLGYRVVPGRMLFQVELASRDSDFHDVPGLFGVINNDDRDRSRRTSRLRGGYEVSDGYAVFLQLRDQTIDYESEFDDNGFDRNAEGFEAVVGAELDITDVIYGDVYYGRKSYSYADPRFSDIGGGSFGVGIEWNLTGLTTLRLDGHKEVAPTTVIGASAIDETQFSVGADHELLRNLILSLDWSRRDASFKGIDRDDENRSIILGARYLMNRRFEVQFEYVHRERGSTTSKNREFSRNLIGVTFMGQL